LGLVGVSLLRSARAARRHVLGVVLAWLAVAGAAAASLFVLTIPDEWLDRAGSTVAERVQTATGVPSALGPALALIGMGSGLDRSLLPRNLRVSDLELSAAAGDGFPINLRGRDLRYATFDRSDLRRADLSGANLEGARFVAADLREATLECVASEQPSVAAGRPASTCVNARHAKLMRARLSGAKLVGIDLSQANLEAAQLQDAQLEGALISGANLSLANLERANARGAQLRAAGLAGASLQGADLSGAQLQRADLSGAKMHAVDLSAAGLEGARLRHAELDAANLSRSMLFAADLTGARLAAADLSGAAVWRTVPPGGEQPILADLTQIVLRPPREQELAELSAASRTDDRSLSLRVAEDLLRPGGAAADRAWANAPEHQAWQTMARPREGNDADQFKSRLTGHLTRLMCLSRWADASVAAGIARRAMAPGFKGHLVAVHERLASADCPASAHISPRLRHQLAVAVELARVQD
jgi:uncharacterized protein YjbI with pentapeptide repeats